METTFDVRGVPCGTAPESWCASGTDQGSHQSRTEEEKSLLIRDPAPDSTPRSVSNGNYSVGIIRR